MPATIDSQCFSTTSPTARPLPRAKPIVARPCYAASPKPDARASTTSNCAKRTWNPLSLNCSLARRCTESATILRQRSFSSTHAPKIALAVGADGVHLPADSAPPDEIRAEWVGRIRRDPIIGVSAHSVNDVLQAERDGSTFAVLAPIFEKAGTGAQAIGIDALREACAATQIPVLALGGVRLGNVRGCLEAGAAGIAGIRLFQENAVSQTVEALRWLEQNVSRSAG